MSFGDGAQYSGGWQHDARSGYGSYRLPNGSCYDGDFKADIPEGSGKLHDADEESDYVGEFHHGLRAGTGSCTYKDGDKFSGEWRDGVRVQGLMFRASGDVEKVGYLNDKVVRREKLSKAEMEKMRQKDGPKEEAPSSGSLNVLHVDQVASLGTSGPAEATVP